jgi:hypothetical protein
MFSWLQILMGIYILSSLTAIIVLSVALSQCNSKCPNKKDGFCNCFGPGYNGSSGDPNMKTYPGTYCTNDKAGLAKSYREGKLSPSFV